MSAHPETQRKAQEGIDRVIGRNRLPNAQDRKDLPYVDAILGEVIRMGPSASPIVLKKTVLTEGTTFRKTQSYVPTADISSTTKSRILPSHFQPDLFMQSAKDKQTEKLRVPFVYAFGHGRRVYSYMHFAIDDMFLAIAISSATLNIDKKDTNGQDIEPRVEYATRTTNHVFHVTASAAPVFWLGHILAGYLSPNRVPSQIDISLSACCGAHPSLLKLALLTGFAYEKSFCRRRVPTAGYSVPCTFLL